MAALRNINCFQCIQFYVSKIGMWLKQSEGVKSLENFHNMEEGSLLNAIGAESFEKMQFDPPPSPFSRIRHKGVVPKARVYSEPFQTSKM